MLNSPERLSVGQALRAVTIDAVGMRDIAVRETWVSGRKVYAAA